MINLNKFKLRLLFLLALCFSTANSQTTQKFKVALDAGHGGHDYGAIYHGHIEKNIALALVLKVGKILEKNPNIEVIYTRKTDVFIDLIERANIANRAHANIFVSIHCNANKNTVADGSETYVMGMTKNASNLEAAKRENSVITLEKNYKEKYQGFNPNVPESMIGLTLMQEEFQESSIALAARIQNNFKESLGKKSRGVKQAPYMVLHKAYMPRVLIETGFISNVIEGAILDSEEGQQDIAQAIAEAIVSYKNEFFGSSTNEPVIDKPTKRNYTVPKVNSPTVEKTDSVSKKVEDTKPKTEKGEALNTSKSGLEVQKVSEAGIVFKVQLSASSKNIELIPANFNGLNAITSTFNNGIYRYMYGATSNYEEAKRALQEAKSKGFSTAFLVAFKDGKMVPIKDVINK